MLANVEAEFRTRLLDRREKLAATIVTSPETTNLLQLLQEVDSALARMDAGDYGVCEACRGEIERELLDVDPLVRYCLPDLTPQQHRALEQDLNLAAQMQGALLPRRNFSFDGWQTHYHYEPVGPVGGDYCDLILPDGAGTADAFYFFLGDVSGKGIASALLVSQLHAVFRSLVALDLPVNQLVERANRILCESIIPAYFATLVCGRVAKSGEMEICNAGHCPPLLIRQDNLEEIEATGLPLGLFYTSEYGARKLSLADGESLFLYTDGLHEAHDSLDMEYGQERLTKLVSECGALPPRRLLNHCLDDLSGFLSGALKTDDLTIMVLRRAGQQQTH